MPKTIAQREHAQRLDAIHANIAAILAAVDRLIRACEGAWRGAQS